MILLISFSFNHEPLQFEKPCIKAWNVSWLSQLPVRRMPLMLQVTSGLGMPSALHSSLTVSPGAYSWLFASFVQYGAARPPQNKQLIMKGLWQQLYNFPEGMQSRQ